MPSPRNIRPLSRARARASARVARGESAVLAWMISLRRDARYPQMLLASGICLMVLATAGVTSAAFLSGTVNPSNSVSSATLFGSVPTVNAAAASSVTATGAQLNGTLSTNRQNITDYHFEYRRTTGGSWTSTSAGTRADPASNAAVNASITGLTPAREYEYRLLATNAHGTSTSSTVNFTTLADAPSVSVSAASAISSSGATLNASLTTNGASVTASFFEYRPYGTSVWLTGPSVGSVADPATNSPQSASLSGLRAGHIYEFRFVATNSVGTSRSSLTSFTTSSTVPTVTTSAATGLSGTSATLNGRVLTNGSNVSDYHFEYRKTGGVSWTVPATGTLTNGIVNWAANPTFESDTSGAAAYDANATLSSASSPSYEGSKSLQITTTAASTGAVLTANATPSSGQSFSGGAYLRGSGTARVVLVWRNSSDTVIGQDNGGYVTLAAGSWQRATVSGTAPAGTASAQMRIMTDAATASATFYADAVSLTQSASPVPYDGEVSASLSGLRLGASYEYRLVATNSSGSATSSPVTSFTVPPATPSAATATPGGITGSSATFYATISTNGAATTYYFEYKRTIDPSWTALSSSSLSDAQGDSAVMRSVSGLVASTNYEYRVTATNSAGSVTSSPSTLFSTLSLPSVSTSAASAITASGATLNGTVSTNGSDITERRFQYRKVGDTSWINTSAATTAHPASGTAVSAAITGLANAANYEYRLVATNSAGTSTSTPVTSFTTLSGAALTYYMHNATVGGFMQLDSSVPSTAISGTGWTVGAVAAGNYAHLAANTQTLSTAFDGTAKPGTTVNASTPTNAMRSPALTGSFVAGNWTFTSTVAAVNHGLTQRGSLRLRFYVSNSTGTSVTAITPTSVVSGGTLSSGDVRLTPLASGLTTTPQTQSVVVAMPAASLTNQHILVTAAWETTTAGTLATADVMLGVGSGRTGLTTPVFNVRPTDAAPEVANGAVSGSTPYQATLNGTVTTNGSNSSVSFQYRKQGDPLWITTSPATSVANPATASAVSATITGLEGGATYEWRTIASNSTGASEAATASFVAPAETSTYEPVVRSTAGLAGYWQLDEPSGTAFYPSVGQLRGSYTASGVSYGVSGGPQGSSAVNLNGSSGYAELPNSSSLSLGDSYTLELWVQRNNTGVAQPIAYKGSQMSVVLNADNTISSKLDGVGNVVTSTTTLTDTASWHHLVVTEDGSSGSRIYLDGADVSGTPTHRVFSSSSNVLRLGYDGSSFANLRLDDVAIYNRALSAAEVGQHYAARQPAVAATGNAGTLSLSSVGLNSHSLTLTRNVPAGELLIVSLGWDQTADNTKYPSTTSDSRGNSWVRDEASNRNATYGCAMLSTVVTTPLQTGDTVTVNWTSSVSGSLAMSAEGFRGLGGADWQSTANVGNVNATSQWLSTTSPNGGIGFHVWMGAVRAANYNWSLDSGTALTKVYSDALTNDADSRSVHPYYKSMALGESWTQTLSNPSAYNVCRVGRSYSLL